MDEANEKVAGTMFMRSLLPTKFLFSWSEQVNADEAMNTQDEGINRSSEKHKRDGESQNTFGVQNRHVSD